MEVGKGVTSATPLNASDLTRYISATRKATSATLLDRSHERLGSFCNFDLFCAEVPFNVAASRKNAANLEMESCGFLPKAATPNVRSKN